MDVAEGAVEVPGKVKRLPFSSLPIDDAHGELAAAVMKGRLQTFDDSSAAAGIETAPVLYDFDGISAPGVVVHVALGGEGFDDFFLLEVVGNGNGEGDEDAAAAAQFL